MKRIKHTFIFHDGYFEVIKNVSYLFGLIYFRYSDCFHDLSQAMNHFKIQIEKQ